MIVYKKGTHKLSFFFFLSLKSSLLLAVDLICFMTQFFILCVFFSADTRILYTHTIPFFYYLRLYSKLAFIILSLLPSFIITTTCV